MQPPKVDSLTLLEVEADITCVPCRHGSANACRSCVTRSHLRTLQGGECVKEVPRVRTMPLCIHM